MRCLRTVQVTLPRAESRLQEGSLMCCCMRKLSLTNIRGILASSSTARRSRKQQGWSLQLTVYCLLISDAKKAKWRRFPEHDFQQRVLDLPPISLSQVLQNGGQTHKAQAETEASTQCSCVGGNQKTWCHQVLHL